MKHILASLILLFVVRVNSQTIDWQNAPLNPAAEYYTLNHYNLNGALKQFYKIDFAKKLFYLDFNKDGYLTQKLTSAAGKAFKKKIEYIYSSPGKIETIKEYSIGSKGEIKYPREYHVVYNQDGLISKKISKENNYTTQFNYDNYKRLVSIKTINPDGSPNDFRTFKYNQQGQLIEETSKSNLGTEKVYKLNYTKLGNDILEVEINLFKDGEPMGKGFSAKGSLTRAEVHVFYRNPDHLKFSANGYQAYKKSAITMRYDQFGNLRERYSKIIDKNMDQVEITYYNGIESKIQENKVKDFGCVSGDCNNGYGQYKLENMTINGYFENGKINGFAEQIFSSRDSYIGNFVNDQREGYGVYVWSATNTRYYGEWKNNKINGYGYITKDDKVSEVGIYQDGKLITNLGQDYLNKKVNGSCTGNCFNGFGTITYNNKDYYTGFFNNNKPYKVGTRMFKASNSLYVGQFDLEGEPTGTGYLTTLDYIYFGKFKNAKVVGKALKLNQSTSKVEPINVTQPSTSSKSIKTSNSNSGCVSGDCNNGYGEYNTDTYTLKAIFKNGKVNGYGFQKYIKDSGYYEGNFVNGYREGYGSYKWQNTGTIYIGQWMQGKQHGYGYYIKEGKVTEAGYYQNGKQTTNLLTQDFIKNKKVNNCSGNCKDGFGMYYYSNGDIYYGFFSNSKKHHLGSYIWKRGSVYIGEYYNGKANGLGDENYKPANTRYFGSFTNGQRDGFGVYFTKTNTVDSYGIWSNGTLTTRY